jgi:hypothetical protein
MKSILLLLCFSVLVVSCNKSRPTKVSINKTGTQIEITVKESKSYGELGQASSSIQLTVDSDGKVSDTNGNKWDSIGQAVDAIVPDLELSVQATRNIMNKVHNK